MYLTTDMLKEKNVCEGQVTIFEKEWPDGVKITKKAIIRAVELGLDIDWFADNFLSAPIWKAYWKAIALARKACEKAIASAWKAYNEVVAPARKAYEEVMASAEKVYQVKASVEKAYLEVIDLALKAYKESVTPVEKAYHKAQALALYKALKENNHVLNS